MSIHSPEFSQTHISFERRWGGSEGVLASGVQSPLWVQDSDMLQTAAIHPEGS